MKIAVIVYPGSNCDHDVLHGFGEVLGHECYPVWYRESSLVGKPDMIVLPGGFSFGDYLRPGAMAKLAPIMREIYAHAKRGGQVLGICNGFQILCETGLLPGVLLQNVERKFLSRFLTIKSSTKRSLPLVAPNGETVTCPVAHFDGNYFADEETLTSLREGDQIVYQYCSLEGEVDSESRVCNPNGSVDSIAGICNKDGNVIGMMPHPERVLEAVVSGSDFRYSYFFSAKKPITVVKSVSCCLETSLQSSKP